jgi:hypothetical protein
MMDHTLNKLWSWARICHKPTPAFVYYLEFSKSSEKCMFLDMHTVQKCDGAWQHISPSSPNQQCVTCHKTSTKEVDNMQAKPVALVRYASFALFHQYQTIRVGLH